MKKFVAIVRDVLFVIFVLSICGIIFLMSAGKQVSFFGYQVLRVLTGSMEPTIDENTCIIMKKVDVNQLEKGDIITFISEDPDIYGYYNTHRIYDVREDEITGEIYYITKGDASREPDPYPVYQNKVVGIYVKELPGGRIIGKVFVALSDNRIYFAVIILPLLLCLLSYFWQIVTMFRYDEEEEQEEKWEGNLDSLQQQLDKLEQKVEDLSTKLEEK